MFICNKCHRRDSEAIECKTPHEQHILGIGSGPCAVCGTHSNLYWCSAYPYIWGQPKKLEYEMPAKLCQAK